MLRRLLQGTNAAAHGGGDHTLQEEPPACSRPAGSASSTTVLVPGVSSPRMLPSSLCSSALPDCCRAYGGRRRSALIYAPSCLLSSCSLSIHGRGGGSVWGGGTQEFEAVQQQIAFGCTLNANHFLPHPYFFFQNLNLTSFKVGRRKKGR